jgi:hypothetical protein
MVTIYIKEAILTDDLTRHFFGRYEEILAKEQGDGVPEKKQDINEEENYDDFDWDAFEKEEL